MLADRNTLSNNDNFMNSELTTRVPYGWFSETLYLKYKSLDFDTFFFSLLSERVVVVVECGRKMLIHNNSLKYEVTCKGKKNINKF